MRYKQLGKTDLNISVIGVGTWQFSGEWGKRFSQEEVNDVLYRAEELGVNFIDTAECYGDHLSEDLIGNAIKKNRKNWIIATKFGHKYKDFLDVEDRWSPQEIKVQLENSLKALRTDYIDIYQFHSGNNKVFDQDDLWSILEKEKKAGSIKYLGISVGDKEIVSNDVYQIQAATERNIDVIQLKYNRLDKEAEELILPECQKKKLGILVRQPLAGGYLSGKYDINSVFSENDVRYWYDKDIFYQKMKLVKEIKEKELSQNMKMSGWAINWCLKNPAVDCVIAGCKDIEQIESNARAINI